MAAVGAGIQVPEIGLSVTTVKIRAVVTVVAAAASVTLDPRGLNPIVLDIISATEVVSVTFLKQADSDAVAAGDVPALGVTKPAQDALSTSDATAADFAVVKADTAQADELRSAALSRTVADQVLLDDFSTRSFNGAYAEQAGADDFSEPVDDLGWSIARAVADAASPGDAYAAAFAMAPINEPALAATDASVALVGKNVADTSTAQDSAPLVAFSRAGDQDSVAAADTVAQAFSSPKDEVVSAADALQPFDLTKNVLDAVAIDDFATRSFNGGYTDQATTDDFSEPVDDLGWGLGRAVSENLYFEDPTYTAADYVFPVVGVTDLSALALSRPVADSASAADAQQASTAKPLTETASSSDSAALSVSLSLADGGSYFTPDYNAERYGIGDLVSDASVRSFSLPKTESVAAADTVFPLDLTKFVFDAVAIDDMASRSFNGSAADEAGTDDFSTAEDDLGWDFGGSQADDVSAADEATGSYSWARSDSLSLDDAAQIVVARPLTESATAVDAPAKAISLLGLADGGSYFTPDYNAERYGVGDLVQDNSTKSFSKSGIADSISLANTGGLVMTDYVDTRWFSDNYTGTYRSLS